MQIGMKDQFDDPYQTLLYKLSEADGLQWFE